MYCTTAELKAHIGKPFSWGVGNAPTEAEGTAIITKIGPDIDAYCRDRYDTPFAPVPDPINTICLILAAERVVGAWLKTNADDPIYKRFRDDRDDIAIPRLVAIQAGKFSLEEGDAASISVVGRPTASTPRDPFFTYEDVP